MQNFIEILDKMRLSAKVNATGSNGFTPEEIQTLLSKENLPEKDVTHGEYRYCHSLIANTKEVATYLGGYSSGNKLYPPGGYLQWHTNSNDIGIRVYCVYATGNGCWFRYINKQKEMVTLQDLQGWNIRAFPITRKAPLWHCVYAGSERYSFGFNCKELKNELIQYMITL